MRSIGRSAVLLLFAVGSCTASEAERARDDPEPAYRLREHEAEYRGPGREDPSPAVDEVRIGWFGTDDPDDPFAGDMWRAASIAIEEANREGGLDGVPFRLLPAWSENPWGTGVAQVTRLVYEERVWALLGSPDGASAHLVEQVTAKARLPFVNPISTDKSTNLANVPWIFSCASGDHSIVPCLAEALAREARGNGIALVSGTDHDSRLTVRELATRLVREDAIVSLHVEFHPSAVSFAPQLDRLRDSRAGAVAVIAGPVDAARFLLSLRDEGSSIPVVGGPRMGHRLFLETAGPAAEGVIFPRLWDPGAAASFRARFTEATGHPPDYTAAHAYDATTLLVAAIRRAGLNRARIRDALRELSPWSGVTGVVVWDPTGHNERAPSLATFRNGRRVPVD